jgi:hypothetical protein
MGFYLISCNTQQDFMTFVEWFYTAMSGFMNPFKEPFLCGVSMGKLSAISGSTDSSGGDSACLSIRMGKRRQSILVAKKGGNCWRSAHPAFA